MSATVPRYFAFERSVDRDCGMRLSLPVWHYSRWSEVQTARCCDCGKVQCYVPKGDDPCVLNAAGANRAVEAPGEVVNWLGQWGLLVPGDAGVQPTWLLAGLRCNTVGSLEMLKEGSRSRGVSPGAQLSEAGSPLIAAPACDRPQLRAALNAHETVCMTLSLPREHAIDALFKLADPTHPAHHVAVDLLARHPGLHAYLMTLHLQDRNAPWSLVLELLHWSKAPLTLWQHLLSAFATMPFTILEGGDVYVRERMCITTTLERLVHLKAPGELLRSVFNTLIQRTATADAQLHSDPAALLDRYEPHQ